MPHAGSTRFGSGWNPRTSSCARMAVSKAAGSPPLIHWRGAGSPRVGSWWFYSTLYPTGAVHTRRASQFLESAFPRSPCNHPTAPTHVPAFATMLASRREPDQLPTKETLVPFIKSYQVKTSSVKFICTELFSGLDRT